MEHKLLQSYGWEKFQQSLGRKTWRMESLVMRYDLPLGKNYLYCPHLDTINSDFIDKVKKIAKQEKSIFLKIEPISDLQSERFGFIKSSKELQPSKTIVLDLKEEDLLSRMHSKTRYNIRLAEKKGVIIKEEGKIEDFLKLLKKTAKRDRFHLHEDQYYRKIVENLDIKILTAEYEGEVIAAGLFYFSGKAIYLYGASDYKHRSLMAPSLLQWKAILKAKELGCEEYDFWGIDEKKWPGVTRFKRRFGGKEISYPGAFDLVFRPVWYKIYGLARKIL